MRQVGLDDAILKLDRGATPLWYGQDCVYCASSLVARLLSCVGNAEETGQHRSHPAIWMARLFFRSSTAAGAIQDVKQIRRPFRAREGTVTSNADCERTTTLNFCDWGQRIG